MKLATYDCEVFAYDWLVIFKDKETGTYTCIWNDNEALKACLDDETIYIGFNSKHYDQFIIKAIAAGFSPQEVKQVNDFIIGGGQGWECPLLRDFYFAINNVDIKDRHLQQDRERAERRWELYEFRYAMVQICRHGERCYRVFRFHQHLQLF